MKRRNLLKIVDLSAFKLFKKFNGYLNFKIFLKGLKIFLSLKTLFIKKNFKKIHFILFRAFKESTSNNKKL